jgi:hypothetical protein
MRIIETNLYLFNELNEEAKEKAISNNSDINVNFNWWQSSYEDAENVWLKIASFNTESKDITGNFLNNTSAYEVAIKIIKEHGEDCETHKTAQTFITDYDNLVCRHSDKINTEIVSEENNDLFDSECDDLESEFLKDLLQDYLIILKNECEYLQSNEAIKETLIANENEFTIDGENY